MYFSVETIHCRDDLKREFRRLSKLHHPDAGGSKERFLEMQAEYESLVKRTPRRAPARTRTGDGGSYYEFLKDSSTEHFLHLPREAFEEGCRLNLMLQPSGTEVRIDIPRGSSSGVGTFRVRGALHKVTVEKK